MKPYMFLIIGIFLLPLVYAESDSLGTFKQGDCINVLQMCGTCTYVNLSSITYPNSTAALNAPTSMTKSAAQFNYTFCNTNALGIYNVNGYGDLDSVTQAFTYTFKITPDGYDTTYKTETKTYSSFDNSNSYFNSHTVGFYLAVASAFGFVAMLFGLRNSFGRKKED